MNQNSLPPIIRQNIEDLANPSISSSVKFNIMLNLENVVKCCNKALSDYKK